MAEDQDLDTGQMQDEPVVDSAGVDDAPEPEPEFNEPEWLDAPYQPPEPQTPPMGMPPYPQQPPPQAPQQWERPNYDADALLAGPAEVIDRHIRQYMDSAGNAMLHLQRQNDAMRRELQQTQERQGRRHKHSVQRLDKEARRAVRDAMKEWSKDPAMSNKVVRDYVDKFVRARLVEGQRRAHEDYDIEMLQGLTDRDFLDVSFEYAKRQAGYRGGSAPAPAAPAGMPKKPGTGAPKAQALPSLTAEEKEFCKIRGISEAEYAKLKKDHEEWSAFG